MGAGNAGRTDGGQMNSTTATKIGVGNINEKGKQTSDNAFRNRGKDSVNKISTPATMILGPALKAGTVVNRDFFSDKVLTSKRAKKNIGYTQAEFRALSVNKQNEVYAGYMEGRLSNKTDAYGNNISVGNDGGNNTPTVIKKNIGGNTIQTTAPTEAEVSQSEAANADEAALKVKKKGRSASIMTGPKGVTRTSTDYSLGKKSLLGQV
jgi:hypothetical protein